VNDKMISIITVNLNNVAGLGKTMESILYQSTTNFEYLIIDGGSTDGSVDLIEKYVNQLTYWVSESDSGIYDAMNKGIKAATGKYCLFLNSGDYLYNHMVIENIEKYLTLDNDLVYGNFILTTTNNTQIIKTPPQKITFDFLFDSSLPHNATFIKRDLFDLYGYYNTNYKIVADWEFFYNTIINKHIKTKHIDLTISVFDGSGISNDKKYRKQLLIERENIKKIYLPELLLDSIYEKKEILKRYNRFKNKKLIKLLKSLKLLNE
jgi:glycosyltransferase involved in cell wall biosynthesis